MSIYTSQGTIRIRCDTKAAAGCCDTGNATIYFVPEKDYSIKHRNENYAVFVPQSCGCPEQSCDCKPQSCKSAIIRKYNPDKGDWIEIRVTGGIMCYRDVISDAATHQKKVEVEVEVKTTLEKTAESKIPEIVKGVAGANNDKKKEAVEKIIKETLEGTAGYNISEIKAVLKKLVKMLKVANESKQCFKLVGITIPAK